MGGLKQTFLVHVDGGTIHLQTVKCSTVVFAQFRTDSGAPAGLQRLQSSPADTHRIQGFEPFPTCEGCQSSRSRSSSCRRVQWRPTVEANWTCSRDLVSRPRVQLASTGPSYTKDNAATLDLTAPLMGPVQFGSVRFTSWRRNRALSCPLDQ